MCTMPNSWPNSCKKNFNNITSSSSFCNYKNLSHSFNEQTIEEEESEEENDLCNVLRLKLRKPEHWKWELFTSKSSANMKLPRILLYDHKGNLLVDARGNNKEQVYKQDEIEKLKREKASPRRWHSFNSNSTHDSLNTTSMKFDNLSLYSSIPSSQERSRNSSCSRCSRSQSITSSKDVQLNITTESGKKPFSHVPIFLPTPPSTTSTSSGPRAKRRLRHSHSSDHSSLHSESILERLSFQRGRSSSPEFSEEPNSLDDEPQYYLSSSKAGTLIVKKDSFQKHPHRRRRKGLRKTLSRTDSFRIPSFKIRDNNETANVSKCEKNLIAPSSESDVE